MFIDLVNPKALISTLGSSPAWTRKTARIRNSSSIWWSSFLPVELTQGGVHHKQITDAQICRTRSKYPNDIQDHALEKRWRM